MSVVRIDNHGAIAGTTEMNNAVETPLQLSVAS